MQNKHVKMKSIKYTVTRRYIQQTGRRVSTYIHPPLIKKYRKLTR